jgi:hypothetical protein
MFTQNNDALIGYAEAGNFRQVEQMIIAGVDVNAANNVTKSHKCIPEF